MSEAQEMIEAGQSVWIKDTAKRTSEAFVKATVKSFTQSPPSYSVVVGGSARSVRPVDCMAANPDGMTAHDNCFLLHISEATILDNLRQRYAAKQIYTYTGSILIAVNPFQVLPVYGHQRMGPYRGKTISVSEPHSYSMAEEAYRTYVKTKKSQSLIVSGESGSGKTETNKHLMHYIAWRTQSEQVVENLADNILHVNPLLEALGNAKTTRNNNSSRFGKFLKLSMGPKGQVLGATTQQYLLERSRVNHQSKGERNYHIFYQTLAGHKSTGPFRLSKGPKEFWYTNQSGLYTANGIDDMEGFRSTLSAFETIGFNANAQYSIFQIIAGLLHLGNISFRGEDNAEVDAAACNKSVQAMTELLGVPDLDRCLVSRTMVLPEATGNERISVNLSPEQALLARDALAKNLYSKLFDWCISQINEKLRGQLQEDGPFIGLLDVYGFESFFENSFEQLCINFANEKLQQFFLRFIFKAEESLYYEECVQWTSIEYQDNQGCIDLIEKSPTGIMRLLDEVCKKPNGSDREFCEAVDHTHKRNDFFMEPRALGRREYTSKDAFVVRHFAGDVCYRGSGFLDKNNDTLHLDFTSRLSNSSLSIVAGLFEPRERTSGRGAKGSHFNSVSRRFINDLNGLLDDLNMTKAHFIRCIKPNNELAKNSFQPQLVLQQLRCSGTIEAVQLMAYAYPTRIPYPSIYDRYAKLMPDFVQKLEPPLFCEALALALDIPSSSFQLGRSRMFFKAGKGQVMEELADRDLEEVVPLLLAKIKQWEARKVASMMLQNYCRMFVWRVRYKNQANAIRAIQHRRRSAMIYIDYRKRHLVWLAKREREENERRAKEAEERRVAEEENKRRLEAAALDAKDSSTRKKAEKAAKEAAKAAAVAQADLDSANEAARAAPTEAQIHEQVAAEMARAADEASRAQGAMPPQKDDLVFTVVLERGPSGLGLDVDHYRKGATIGYISADGVAGKDGTIKVGDMIQGVNGVKCIAYDAVISAIRNAGKRVELSLRRKHVSMLLSSKMHMQVGADLVWEEFHFRLYSNRELTFEKTQPPAYNSNIDVRLAHEVRLVDAPNGGGFLEIETASKTYALRSEDSAVLHAWRRELYELLPYLHVTEVKCGWLYKRGETANASFKRRFCMLFSSYRLLYFESEACTKRKGAVDLSVAESVVAKPSAKGYGFEISTPGRTWAFAAETEDEMCAWMSTLSMMLGDIQERKKRQEKQQGVVILKEGWADLKDETQEGDGAWEAHWFSLNSQGELRVFRDHEASEEEVVLTIVLNELERVERSKGIDFYDFCIDLIGMSKTARMRPIDRGDMQAWLGVLQTQLSAFTQRSSKQDAVVTTLHSEWLEKKSERVAGQEVWKNRWFVLKSRQEKIGDVLDVQYSLHYFRTQEAASDGSEGGVIDLGDVDEVRKGEKHHLSIVSEEHTWQLRAASEAAQDVWLRQLLSVCGEAAEVKPAKPPPPTGGSVSSIASAQLKMQVPGADGQACWKVATFSLHSDGILRWKSAEPWPWDEGFIEIRKALGVWLLGPPGWRRLDIILPEHRWTLAADDDEVLQKWVSLLEDVAPEKPVSEIRNGWMEKRGAGGAWKLRFFVLLSTHELLYFESDRSPKCKGVIDLKEASACQRVADPDYNYEFSFEVRSSKRTWILCPDDLHAMQEWMGDIRPLIVGAGGVKPLGGSNGGRASANGGAGAAVKRKPVVASGGVRSYEQDASGRLSIDAGGTTLKTGWLEKRGELNAAWKRRYFVLTDEATGSNGTEEAPKLLRYFKDEDSYHARKNCCTVELDESARIVMAGNESALEQSHFEFEINAGPRVLTLAAASQEDLAGWVEALGIQTSAETLVPSTPRPEETPEEASNSVSTFMASGPLVQVHSGWLKKKKAEKGVFGGRSTKRCYFVLYENRELHYFEGASIENLVRKGSIRVSQASAIRREKPLDRKDFTFKILVPGRDWILDPGDQATFDAWQEHLTPMLRAD